MRILIASAILLTYILFCYGCWWHYRRRHQPARRPDNIAVESAWLIAYASQTGTAELIAQQTAQQFEQAGMSVILSPLNQVDVATLNNLAGALFIVSTYGEGEPPDNGNRFLHRLPDTDLTHLRYAMLALGDSDYVHFCGFGHALHRHLHQCGAHALFDPVEVNRRDESALRHWQYYLGQLSGHSHFADWSQPQYESWRLQERRCINPGSPGAPAFFLQLTSLAGVVDDNTWTAGDIAEIGPCNSDERVARFLQALGSDGDMAVALADGSLPLFQRLKRKDLPQQQADILALTALDDAALLDTLPDLPHREYSIASTPHQGTLDLLVRQVSCPVNGFGLGSGWLTQHAVPGGDIQLRIRSNSHFHPPAASAPLILIGNGTGIAGLRAHLLARMQQGATRNWLLFGERSAATDFFFGDELTAWRDTGVLQRLDLVFSRDRQNPDTPRYVQDLLPPLADILRAWIEEGAAIYVCGSLQGMAQGVDTALEQILGRDRLEELQEGHRYCRDVY